ncbi:translation initiation factor IF-2 [Brevundimonas albigilva]|uniref:Translation initiation factor IF-2 n=3 Tax=Brevundimonas TaxID=41275 RepID=A0ABY4SJ01_9CAUL|nr:translation initiation factor IF-2 [Brevundimonas albigilva]UQV17215.1 translation initiation factor IF-2 [Brevundimonas albigilva]URI14967.1 translation initiation factor IF-2 [Brevundimonas albigilva]
MSDENDKTNQGQGSNTGGAPSQTGPRAPLSLKPRAAGSVSTGTVKQSFSHGRSKTVVVETKRRVGASGPQRPQGFDVARPRNDQGQAPRPQAPRSSQPAGGALSPEEQEARRRAIALATQANAERERAAAAERAQREAEAREQAAATERAAQAARDEAAAAKAAAEAARAEAAKLAAAAPAPAAKPAPKPAAPAPAAPAAPAAQAPTPAQTQPPAAPSRPAAPARPAVNFGQRAPKPGNPQRAPAERPAFGGRSAREQAMGGGERSYSDRPERPSSDRPQGARSGAPGARPQGARPAEPVRYSALNPRPAPGGARPGGPRTGPGGRAAPNAPPATPEVARPSRSTGAGFGRPVGRDDDRDKRFSDAGKAVSRTRGEPKRREGRMTIQSVVGDGDAAERMRSLASVRRAREREKEKRKGGSTDAPNRPREVVIPDVITVQELSNRMAVRGVDIIKFLMRQGMMMKINDVIDSDTAELVAEEFGMAVKRVSESDIETGFLGEADDAEASETRAPVVAIMGHVDHGKTSLLDALRTTDVAAGEAGGITQHIGAYQVRLEDGQKVTFLDTPGHAAFSAMRARGATVTDIVVLVVAADDGVMPQTIEAIQHAKAAGAPIIVAVNKIDKPDANPQKVVNELLQYEVIAESLGGDTQIIEVSAKNRTNLDGLLEAILIQAEVMDLRANPDRSAEGVVIEAKLDKGRGPVGTVLVKRGTLKRGDIVVAGGAWGKVRALLNERNEQLTEAGPSVPVEILGLDEAPSPGDVFAVVDSEARARELTEYRQRVKREKAQVSGGSVSLVDMMAKLGSKKISELPVVIKSDVQGSGEAIAASLEKMGNDEVRARIVYSGAGGITESDVNLAKSAGAPILGFNVRASKQARDLAEREGVEIRYYAIIYDLLDDMKGVLSGMLAPLQRETFLGNAQVLQVFDISKVGKIAGCRVTEGVVRKGARVRIIRDDVVVLELGVLNTLKRFKDEVNEVPSGQECGMQFAGFQDIKEGDYIECFTVEEIKRTLD